ncbi:MAG: hypothetical protein J3K34DRAFT_20730 [Monoraphidium minutum]|nr:MAG: hypothetical protein J3K34DRAFT_20730 [Monoraphidium minutum]
MAAGAVLAVVVAAALARPSLGMLAGWVKTAMGRGPGAAPRGPLPPPDAFSASPREVPLPYSLQDKPHPRGYVALRAPAPLTINGDLQKPAWAAVPWSDEFLDIVGVTGPKPWAPARVKMLWDDDALYVAASLQDGALFANNTLHDSIIYHDNNFEIFIDPDGDNYLYYEIEINGLGAVWDLLLARPYRNGGPPIDSWETLPPAAKTMQTGPTGWAPMRHAVRVDGRINSKEGTRSWQVEAALPWSLLRQAAGGRRVPPQAGDAWRINFSRVMWTVQWDDKLKKYVKDPPDQEPFNFVWSPQYQVAMHQPETWGYVQFEDQGALDPRPPPPFAPDPTWPARAYLMEIYAAQHRRWQLLGSFSDDLGELGVGSPRDGGAVRDVTVEVTSVSFVASASVPPPQPPAGAAGRRRRGWRRVFMSTLRAASASHSLGTPAWATGRPRAAAVGADVTAPPRPLLTSPLAHSAVVGCRRRAALPPPHWPFHAVQSPFAAQGGRP